MAEGALDELDARAGWGYFAKSEGCVLVHSGRLQASQGDVKQS